MLYIISFLAVAAVPLAVAGYGAHLAAKILESPERRKALAIIWVLAVLGVVLSGLQQILAYRTDHEHEIQQAALQAKAEQNQQQLREKLDSSLRRQEDVTRQLSGILEFLHTPPPAMNSRNLADATARMVEDAMHR